MILPYYNHTVKQNNRKGTKMIKTVKELKEFRAAEKLSQRELAKLTKISRGTIATWERTGRITTDGLKRLNTKLFPPTYATIYGEIKKQETKGRTSIMGWLAVSLKGFPLLKSRRVVGRHPTEMKGK